MRHSLVVTTRSELTLIQCCKITQSIKLNKNQSLPTKNWKRFIDPITQHSLRSSSTRLGNKWMEYQGIKNWEGLLDPLDDKLREEILRYGDFVEAAYASFDFDPSSPTYASCRFSKSNLFDRSGLHKTSGYRVTKHLRATSGIQLPSWIARAANASWAATRSSWIGYVAVCHDKEEIARLGRRDVVIAYRGTTTCLEWLENFRTTLTPLQNSDLNTGLNNCMVERGFQSLYTSKSQTGPSLQEMVGQEITKLVQSYEDEPISFTITGHSLGAALATLTAFHIKTMFENHINHCVPVPQVTVISFGGPRVGNRCFGQHLEKQGIKVLRIVNSDDPITKLPGFTIDKDDQDYHVKSISRKPKGARILTWIQKHVRDTRFMYADLGRELRLSSKDSPHLRKINVAGCHDLKTYLHLVSGYVSSSSHPNKSP